MNWLFRAIGVADSPDPATGEVYIQPADPSGRKRCDLAAAVLKQGVERLRQGESPAESVVVNLDPTLDEMLAATFAAELLAGRTLPAGAEPFARYAELVREGHIPSKLPLENSLEGLYLAILNADGGDLAKPQVAERFLSRWQRLAELILESAQAGVNPFTTPLAAEGSEFAREQAFLARDREVFRQDVKRGEQWSVSIPGGPPRGMGLLLRQPKSLLFKQWSRSEQRSGAGEPFVFLAVDWGGGQWVFSTDPVMQIPIRSLAERLQAAEAKLDADGGAENPWFDGEPFGYTLVAAPRGGSKLADAEVLSLVRRWAGSPVRRAPRAGRWTGALASIACVLIGLAWWFHRSEAHGSSRGVEFLSVSSDSIYEKVNAHRSGSDYALFFATDDYDHWPHLCNAQRDASKIADLLQSHYGFTTKHIERCWNFSKDDLTGKLEDYLTNRHFSADDQLLIYIAGHGQLVDTKGYLIARDSLYSQNEDSRVRNSSIDLAVVRDDVEKIRDKGCGHVFLIMDTCFGGMIDFDVATERAERGTTSIRWTPERKDLIVARKMLHPCCAYITSVGKESASDGDCAKSKAAETHSPFAQSLIDLFEQPPPGGLITIPHILSAVLFSTQEPRHGYLRGHDSNGDFVFIWQK